MLSTMISPLAKQIHTLWQRLAEPTSSVRGPEQQRKCHLLTSLLLAIWPLILLTFVLRLPMNLAMVAGLDARPVTCLFILIAYALSRQGYYKTVSLLLAVYGSLIILALAVGSENIVNLPLLDYLVVFIIFGSLFLSMRTMAAIFLAQIIGVLLLAAFIPQLTLREVVGEPLTFNLTLGTITLWVMHYRNTLETRRQTQLLESEACYHRIIETAQEGIWVIGKDLTTRFVNKTMAEMLGYSPAEMLGRSSLVFFEDGYFPIATRKLKRQGEDVSEKYDLKLRAKDGAIVWALLSTTPILNDEREFDGSLIMAINITEQKRAEEFRTGQKHVLELIATGKPLTEILTSLIQTVETQVPGMIGSILLLDSDGIHVRHGAAPGLPETYIRAIDGEAIGPNTGSCGTAAYHNKLVIVENIAIDPLWVDYRDLALSHNLQACWSQPIHATDGSVLGTFAIYYRQPRRPAVADIKLIEDAAHLAGIAIERKQAEEALRNSEVAEREQRILAEALRDTAATLTSTLDLDLVMSRILDNVGRVLPHDRANIMLVEGDTARVAYWHHYPVGYETFFSTFRLPLATQNLCHMMSTCSPFMIADTATYAGWVNVSETAAVRSYAAAPICIRGRVIGFLNLDSLQSGFFTMADTERLQIFADQAAIAIENAQLYTEIRRYATKLELRVTERTAALEQERAQLQAILDAMTEGVAYMDLDNGQARYVNPAFAQLTGLSGEAIVGQSMSVYAVLMQSPGGLTSAQQLAVLQRIKRGATWHGEVRIQRRDDTELEAGLTFSAVTGRDGLAIGAIALIRDIGQEKTLQAQRARFIASASHELRTPVTSFKIHLYLTRKQPEKITEHLNAMENATAQMVNLIENLLDLSQFERGMITLHRQKANLQDLISGAIADQQWQAEQKQVRFSKELPSVPLYIWVDPARLTQVINNLLTNAIKYTPAAGQVLVTVVEVDEGSQVLIRVQDTGIGISSESLPRLFEAFYRASENATQGTGLGLAISKEIVEQHGGHITAESELGKGSIFSIYLPLRMKKDEPNISISDSSHFDS